MGPPPQSNTEQESPDCHTHEQSKYRISKHFGKVSHALREPVQMFANANNHTPIINILFEFRDLKTISDLPVHLAGCKMRSQVVV
jgi:hypothetical protein